MMRERRKVEKMTHKIQHTQGWQIIYGDTPTK